MQRQISRGASALVFVAALALLVSGCGQAENKTTQASAKDAKDSKGKATSSKQDEKGKEHDHSGWWCGEHGVPEAECSMCNAKVAAEFKKKADWCDKHERAKSQCFICDPKLREKYAAQYRAKEGKEPPVPEENGGKKDEKNDKK